MVASQVADNERGYASNSQENRDPLCRLGFRFVRRSWTDPSDSARNRLSSHRSYNSFLRVRVGSPTVIQDPRPLSIGDSTIGTGHNFGAQVG
jgi:hypothetical protein